MQRTTCIFRALSGASCLFLNSIPVQDLLTHNRVIAVAIKLSKATKIDLNIKQK